MIRKSIDIVVCLCVLIIVACLGNRAPNMLGGAISFIIFVPIFYYVSYFIKTAQLETTILNIVILLIIGINLLHGIDIYRVYNKSTIIIAYCSLIILMLISIYLSLSIHLKEFENKREDNKVVIIKTNYRALLLKYTLFPFLYVLVMCITFASFSGFSSVKTNVIKMIPLTFACITISLIILNLALRKIKIEHMNLIFHEAVYIFPKRFKFLKFYSISAGIIFILGLVTELGKNEWFLWFESFLAINIVLILIWKIFTCRIKLNPTIEIKDMSDPKLSVSSAAVIRLAVLNIIGITLVLCGLITLIFMLN